MHTCPQCGYSPYIRPTMCEYCSKYLTDDDAGIGEECDHGYNFCSVEHLRAYEKRFPNMDRSCCVNTREYKIDRHLGPVWRQGGATVGFYNWSFKTEFSWEDRPIPEHMEAFEKGFLEATSGRFFRVRIKDWIEHEIDSAPIFFYEIGKMAGKDAMENA